MRAAVVLPALLVVLLAAPLPVAATPEGEPTWTTHDGWSPTGELAFLAGSMRTRCRCRRIDGLGVDRWPRAVSRRGNKPSVRRDRMRLVRIAVLAAAVWMLALAPAAPATANPEGSMSWAVHISLAPT